MAFETKQTTLYLKRWAGEATVENIIVLFTGVDLQDLKKCGTFSLLRARAIEEAKKPAACWRWGREWLARRRKYISVGGLDAIAADTSLRSFSIEAGWGFDGFIICKDLLISTQEQHT